MNNFGILKYVLLSFAAVILLNTNVAAEQGAAGQYYIGAEGGFSLYDDTDEARQDLANLSGQTISSPNGVGGARAFIGFTIADDFALELGGFWFSDLNFSGNTVDFDFGVIGGEGTIVFKPKALNGFFVRAGGHYSKVNADGTILGFNFDLDENGVGYLVGAGYEASGLIFDNDSLIRVAYARYGALYGDSDSNSNFFSLGFVFPF